MQLAYEALKKMRDGRFHSGSDLATRLKVSRTGIWKAVQFLESLGVEIYAVQGKGYRLAAPLEMLNKEEIYKTLMPSVLTVLNQFDVLNLTTSTNDYLLQRAHPHLLDGYACVAEGQTQGRGRLGRKWISPFGANLYFSIYWHFKLKALALSGLSLAVGVAVLKAVESLTNTNVLSLKWPNDVLHDNAKLGGILVEILPVAESHSLEAQHYAAVIGIGINVNSSRAAIVAADRPITSLENMVDYKLSRNRLVASLLNHLVPTLQIFQQEGFSPFKSSWDQYDCLKGEDVTMTLPKSTVSGRALGVNERGELCLDVAGQKRAFQCGEANILKENNDMKNCYV